MKQDTPKSYDEHYAKHPARWADPQDVDYIIRDIILLNFGTSKVNLLDMGCGQGRTIKILCEDIPKETIVSNYKIIGIDWSREALELARKKNSFLLGSSFKNMDMRDTPFANEEFNAILSVGSHEHLYRIDFSEPYRLLTKKGLFLCVLPTFSEVLGWDQTGPQWEWKITRNEWKRHLHGDGFEIIEAGVEHPNLFVCTKV